MRTLSLDRQSRIDWMILSTGVLAETSLPYRRTEGVFAALRHCWQRILGVDPETLGLRGTDLATDVGREMLRLTARRHL